MKFTRYVALPVLLGVTILGFGVSSSVAQQADAPVCTQESEVLAGEGYSSTARRVGVSPIEMKRCNPWLPDITVDPGDILRHPPGTTAPPVTSTVPPTTQPPTTTAPATTTTTTTTTAPATTLPPSDGEAFAAVFNDGDDDLNRLFDYGLWHRDNNVVAQTSWTGDHDEACGSPATQRTIERANPDDAFYECRNHLMTSIGDTSGYSIGWFSPKQTFNGQTTVSIDVNSTNLGVRQWVELSLVPADYDSGVDGCGPCIAGVTAISDFFPSQPDNTLVWGHQLGGQRLMIDNESLPRSINKLCNGANPIDPEGCASKPIRRTWTMVDNLDGTITLSLPELGVSHTQAGAFPTGDWKLVVKDHNYTPLKGCDPGDPGGDGAGSCAGFTWHYDNVIVD